VYEEALPHWRAAAPNKKKKLYSSPHTSSLTNILPVAEKKLSTNVMVALLAYLVQIQSRRRVSSPFPVVLLNPYTSTPEY